MHHSKDSHRRLKKAITVVMENSDKNEYSQLDEKFKFLYDRNINSYNYAIYDEDGDLVHQINIPENRIVKTSKQGFSVELKSYKEWIFIYVQKNDGKTFVVQNRHEVDIIDDFLWSLLFTFPFLIILTYKLCKKISSTVVEPLSRINSVSNLVRNGKLDARISEDRTDKDIFLTIKNLNACFDSLEESFNKLNQFSVDVAHELKNPLATALASLQIALTRDREVKYYKNSIEGSIEDLKQIQSIVDSVLILHQDESKLKDHFCDVDFSELIKMSVSKYLPKIEEKKINFTSQNEPHVLVHANADLLNIVMNNLLQNAVKFVDESGSIFLSLSQEKLVLRNSGEPIPPELLTKVFDSFMKVEKSRSTEGYGIGLSIVKWICELHSFKIEISSNLDEGTTVSLHFKN